MPYRRLPNTDNARIKAMHIARKKGKELPPFKLAYSQNAFQKLESLLPSYEHALAEHKNCYTIQLEKSKGFTHHFRKARLYLSHFIQVVNMAIIRGELPQNTRAYFGLPEDDKKMPPLITDEDIICWGKKLLDGEQQRKMEGKTTIMNPTAALVKVHYDKFYDYYVYQDGLKKRTLRAQEDLNNKRLQADQIIQQIWNEVENTFKDLPDELKREKSAEYGVIYFYRKNEIQNLRVFDTEKLHIG